MLSGLCTICSANGGRGVPRPQTGRQSGEPGAQAPPCLPIRFANCRPQPYITARPREIDARLTGQVGDCDDIAPGAFITAQGENPAKGRAPQHGGRHERQRPGRGRSSETWKSANANVFYYLTNRLRLQGFCSELWGAQTTGSPCHRWRLVKRMHRSGLLCHGVSLVRGKGKPGARAPTPARLLLQPVCPPPPALPTHSRPGHRGGDPVASGPWEAEWDQQLWPPPRAWHSGGLCAHVRLIAAAPGRAGGDAWLQQANGPG